MKKILVIRVGRAGDMVMITPALLALLDNYPDHELHILTSQDGKRVLFGFDSRVTKIYMYEKSRLLNTVSRLKQIKEIQQEGYDYIFNFELKSSYKKIYRKLEVNIFELDETERQLNYAKRCLNVIQKSIHNEMPSYWDWLPVTKNGVDAARAQLSSAGVNDTDFVIGMHPSFSGLKKGIIAAKNKEYLREWPPEHFASLAKLIYRYASDNDINMKIIMDLLPEERTLGESIVKMSGGVISLFTDAPNFERYKATIKRMNLLITPNTGPMHIAAAVKTNIVALFVDWDPADCGPYMENKYYEVLRAEELDDNEIGLKAIKPENVLDACKRFLPKNNNE